MDQLEWSNLDKVAPYFDLKDFAQLFFLGMLFFFCLHLVLHFAIRAYYAKYTSLPSKELHEYRMQVNAFVHACCAIMQAIYGMLYACGDDKTFFNDRECREVPRYVHKWAMFFTGGYLTVESIFVLTCVGLNTPMDKQQLLHHVIGVLAVYLAFWEQDYTINIGVAHQFLEISTPFIVIRWLLFHHDLGKSSLQALNSVFLFISFIFLRTMYQVIFNVAYVYGWMMDKIFVEESTTLIYRFILLIIMLLIILNLALNFVWSWKIFAQLHRIIKRGCSAEQDFEGNESRLKKDDDANIDADLSQHDDQAEKKVEMKKMLARDQVKSDQRH